MKSRNFVVKKRGIRQETFTINILLSHAWKNLTWLEKLISAVHYLRPLLLTEGEEILICEENYFFRSSTSLFLFSSFSNVCKKSVASPPSFVEHGQNEAKKVMHCGYFHMQGSGDPVKCSFCVDRNKRLTLSGSAEGDLAAVFVV